MGLFWHTLSSPSVPGAVGSLALSTLTVNLTLTPALVLAPALDLIQPILFFQIRKILEQQRNLSFLFRVRARDKATVRLRFRVKTQRVKELTAPGPLGLVKQAKKFALAI